MIYSLKCPQGHNYPNTHLFVSHEGKKTSEDNPKQVKELLLENRHCLGTGVWQGALTISTEVFKYITFTYTSRSTIFKVFGMTQTGIEPKFPGPWADTLPTRPIVKVFPFFLEEIEIPSGPIGIMSWQSSLDDQPGDYRFTMKFTIKLFKEEPVYLHSNIEDLSFRKSFMRVSLT